MGMAKVRSLLKHSVLGIFDNRKQQKTTQTFKFLKNSMYMTDYWDPNMRTFKHVTEGLVKEYLTAIEQKAQLWKSYEARHLINHVKEPYLFDIHFLRYTP